VTALVITTYNRTTQLARSLARLSNLTVPDEVIVVDDGGTDGCEEMCDGFRDILPIRYIYTHHPGPQLCSHARNVAINATKADLIIQTEPEILFDTDVVAQFLTRHEENPSLIYTAGTIHHIQKDGSVNTLQNWAASYAAIYDRSWLLAVGGWDESFPEPWGWDDIDLYTRIRAHLNVNQRIDPDIVVTHQWHEQTANDQSLNADHFFRKGFGPTALNGEWMKRDNPDVIIPRDQDWGKPYPRP